MPRRWGGSEGAYPPQSYEYNALGNLLRQGDTTAVYGTQSASCVAGDLYLPHALVSQSGPTGAQSLCYDTTGNLVQRTGAAGNPTYTDDG